MKDKLTYRDFVKRLDNRTKETEEVLERYNEEYIKPFLKKMDNAVTKTRQAGGRIIGIFDYDCDGIMSALICRQKYSDMEVHIGDRYVDGYGIIKDLSFLKENDLVILSDIGATEDVAVRDIIKRTGNYPFIIDHHEVSEKMEKYPRMLDFTNPRMGIPFNERPDWCASGMMFQLLYDSNPTPKQLYLSALYNMCGTIADVVKVNNPYDTNREDIKFAFDIVDKEPNLDELDTGFIHFLRQTAMKEMKHMNTSTLNFRINPVINALGRIGTINDYGVTGGQFLFDTLDPQNVMTEHERRARVQECLAVNEKRKDMERTVLTSDQYLDYVKNFNSKVAVMYIPDLHRGICGRIAQSLVSSLKVPAICLCGRGNEIVGSARNVLGYPNMMELAEKAMTKDMTIGGHPDAFGLKMTEKDIQRFVGNLSLQYLNVKPEKTEIQTTDLSTFSIYKFLKLEPYGIDFPAPYANETITVRDISQYKGGWTSIKDGNIKYFGQSEDVQAGETVRFEGSVGVSYFAGQETLQVSFDSYEKVKEKGNPTGLTDIDKNNDEYDGH